VLVVFIVITVSVAADAYYFNWWYTGFGNKTLWDFLELAIIPISLAIAGLLFTKVEKERDREREDQRSQEIALHSYFDKISELIISNDLQNTEEGNPVRTIARARTLSILKRLDESLFRFVARSGKLQGLPGGRDTSTEVMKRTANLHHHITRALFEETTGFFEDT